jgi:hypothetical protein
VRRVPPASRAKSLTPRRRQRGGAHGRSRTRQSAWALSPRSCCWCTVPERADLVSLAWAVARDECARRGLEAPVALRGETVATAVGGAASGGGAAGGGPRACAAAAMWAAGGRWRRSERESEKPGRRAAVQPAEEVEAEEAAEAAEAAARARFEEASAAAAAAFSPAPFEVLSPAARPRQRAFALRTCA